MISSIHGSYLLLTGKEDFTGTWMIIPVIVIRHPCDHTQVMIFRARLLRRPVAQVDRTFQTAVPLPCAIFLHTSYPRMIAPACCKITLTILPQCNNQESRSPSNEWMEILLLFDEESFHNPLEQISQLLVVRAPIH